ncbi:MAG TPA: hypothetical protein VMG40_14645 [Bryobacteraceae bacterium]|nr:hypothetical protein [Bryobacteraceae bacterium]
MKPLGAVATSLVLATTLVAFGLNYNASKSNTGNIILTAPEGALTQAQVGAILSELDKSKTAPTEAAVRQVLAKQGVPANRFKKVLITTAGGSKGYGIMLLADPQDEATARVAMGTQYKGAKPGK